jgi:SAM-dependent methyltransferase
VIHFGVCVGPGDSYERRCRPLLESAAGPSPRILTIEDATSIFTAYNRMIDDALAEGADALVLLHDDVAIHDRNLLPRIRRRLREPDLGVIGVIGGRGLWGMRWEESRERFGRVHGPTGVWRSGPLRGHPDVVDGLMMVLTREAMSRVRFDEGTYSGFHGYDSDYCFSVRRAGLRVVTEPFDVHHHSNGDPAGAGFRRSEAAFLHKWRDTLERPPLAHRRPHLATALGEVRHLGRLADPLVTRVADDLARIVPVTRRTIAPAPATSRPSVHPRRPVPSPPAPVGPPACPVCGAATGARPLVSTGARAVHRCTRCDLGVTSPPPDPEIETDAIFVESYDGGRLARRALWDRAAGARMTWIEAFQPDGLLLEIGSATGEQVLAATRRGFEAHGVEPSRWAAAQARASGAEVMEGTLDDWCAGYGGFTVDVVAMFHVLEHLPDPLTVLRSLREVTAASGFLFVEVPNLGSRRAREGDDRWPHWQLPFHVTHLTVTGLTRLLTAAGWEPVEVRETTMRPYVTRRAWDDAVAAAREAGHAHADRDLLRAVARPAPD